MKRILLVALFLSMACTFTVAEDNALSETEQKAGWILLFDGTTTGGWLSIKKEPVPARHVQKGALNPHPCNYMLIHEKEWGDFVLSLDFKISSSCNSGIFFRTSPLVPRPGEDVGFNGLEIAIDDTKGAGFHDTGAIYDLVRPAKNAMKPAGVWNRIVLTCKANMITVQVNGVEVIKMDLDKWSEKNRRPDGSEHKFDTAYKDHPRKGYIGLQDHGSDCWFKNIKLKPLTTHEYPENAPTIRKLVRRDLLISK